jgi:hypothetical protein
MEQAQADIKRITSDTNGFAKTIVFTSKLGSPQTATIAGIHSKIHLGVDTEGNMVHSKRGHISFSESLLTDQGYPTRDAEGRCDMKGHLVTVTDSTGTSVQYILKEVFPDETVGLIVGLLSDWEDL